MSTPDDPTFSCKIPTQHELAAQVFPPPDSFMAIAAIAQLWSPGLMPGAFCKAFSICCGVTVWQAKPGKPASARDRDAQNAIKVRNRDFIGMIRLI